jgi:predicted nucleic acid-binding protein
MSFLIDTNILLRDSDQSHPMYFETNLALKLLKNNNKICITSQNLIEFWNVYTRPISKNGLGFTAKEAKKAIDDFKKLFFLLPENPNLYETWERLADKYGILGVKVHDNRLVAMMIINQIDYIMTWNVKDFNYYSEIIAFSPQDIISRYTP